MHGRRFRPTGDRADRPVRDLLPADLRQMVELGPGGRTRWLVEAVAKAVIYPRVRTVVYFRISQVFARRRLAPLAAFMQARAIRSSGAEIAPGADIGPGLCLMHSVGIVVGAEVVAGRNLRLYQQTTLGDGTRPGQPTIGDDVIISTGATVLGGVRIGDRALVGAHAVVTHDVPADTVATGAPATSRPRRPDHGAGQADRPG